MVWLSNDGVIAPIKLKDPAGLDEMTEFHIVSAGSRLVIVTSSLTVQARRPCRLC